MRLVHYINQFFAGIGGEDKAGVPPERRDGPVGPGRKLADLLGDEHSIVATVVCGDNYAASNLGAAAEILTLVREGGAEMLVAGPAFGSGRYGIACARVTAAAAAAGLSALAAMHPDNPGLSELGGAPAVATGPTARDMGATLPRMARAVAKLAAGGALTAEDGRIDKPARRNVLAETSAAERAVGLALSRLRGEESTTEVEPPQFGRITPATPLEHVDRAVVALLTEGALVPAGNPERLESARAKRWLRYPLEGKQALAPGQYQCVHGGFSTVAANADPHRILPLDVARELEGKGEIGGIHAEYLVTAGNGTAVADAARFGTEWAAELRRAGVQAAILTST